MVWIFADLLAEIKTFFEAIVKVFKKCGLSIVVDTNLKTVSFLDVIFDLDKNIYKPCWKPVNKNSNHPPNVLKQLPKSIAKRISEILLSEEIFNKSINICRKALKESDFMDQLKYLPNEVRQVENNEGRKHKRKTIWFNPPYSKNVKTNVGKVFLKLLKKHCPAIHVLNKIFNENTVKIRYGCLKNINSVVPSHNKRLKSQNNVVWV